MPRVKPGEIERRNEVRQLFRVRHPDKRDGDEVAMFHAWLTHHRPDLLPPGKGSFRYQCLMPDLKGLWNE
jgi:hypothetical protein